MALVALPTRTFADVAAIGCGLRVYCPACYRQSEADLLSDILRDRPFFSTRFRCRGVPHTTKQPCQSLGHVPSCRTRPTS